MADVNTREIAKQLIEEGQTIGDQFIVFKGQIENMLLTILKALKDKINEIPDEETFLKVLADMGDIAYQSNNPIIEAIDGAAIYFVLKQIDKYVLDRFFGVDWFAKLKAQVNA